jgi:hypothetical protein
MRDYVERLEEIQEDLPEGEEPTHEMAMERYYSEAGAERDTLETDS